MAMSVTIPSADGLGWTAYILGISTNTHHISLSASGSYNATISSISSSGGTLESAIGIFGPTFLEPGDGWDGPTSDPPLQGSGIGLAATQSTMIRSDFVPYQTQTGLFNVGVVSFFTNGISYVAFGLDAGAWLNVSDMAYNPDTANVSGRGATTDVTGKGVYNNGIMEYFATADCSQLEDDVHEIRAIGWTEHGYPTVISGMFFVSNRDGTYDEQYMWVSGTGSDVTGDGTLENPWRTIANAVAFANARGSGNASRFTIYCLAGTYSYGWPSFSQPSLSGMNGWLTIATDPDTAFGDAVITSRGIEDGFKNAWIHLKNIKIAPTDNTTILISSGTTAKLWLDGVEMVGAGISGGDTYITTQFYDPQSFIEVYCTESSQSVVRNAYWFVDLARNCTSDNVGTVVHRSCQGAIINCETSDVLPLNIAVNHSDVNALFDTGNVIYYGVKATDNIHAQGIFGPHSGSPLLNVALVANVITVVDEGWAVWTIELTSTNVLAWNCDFVGQANWGEFYDPWTATAVVLDTCTFSVSPGPKTGVTYR